MKSDFLGSRSRILKFAGVGVRSRILKFAGVGVGSRILKFAGVGVRSESVLFGPKTMQKSRESESKESYLFDGEESGVGF